jgi:RNA polymerase sigma-70 factor (ECF subfamily)
MRQGRGGCNDAALAWEHLCKSFAFYCIPDLESASDRHGADMTNAQQFEVFMRNYQNMVFSTAMRLLANQAEAEDVTQEVFLKAYERFDALGQSPTAGGWLKTVATNLSLNHLSRYRSRWSFFSDLRRPDREESDELEFPAADNVEADVERGERHAAVEQALQGLPEHQRVPLVLFHIEGLSYEEIAAKLGVSLGKVKTDIFRARESLRKKLRLKLHHEELLS